MCSFRSHAQNLVSYSLYENKDWGVEPIRVWHRGCITIFRSINCMVDSVEIQCKAFFLFNKSSAYNFSDLLLFFFFF